jgi:DMSO/TMAO reductase YedYZ molybdopterin-dependent catalytic subunit
MSRFACGVAPRAPPEEKPSPETRVPDDLNRRRQMDAFEAMSPSSDGPSAPAKLTQVKQRWADEGKGLTREPATSATRRLPPGQHLVNDFPVVDLGTRPHVAPSDWSLKVGGAVQQPLHWNWDTLLRQPQEERVNDFHCVTFWSRFDNVWSGVPIRQVLATTRPRPEARFVIIRGFDGYTTNLPIEILDRDDVLLATHWQGQPLTREHGAPARLVVPGRYFWKSAKWIRSMHFSDRDMKGYWESHGNHNQGDPWREQRYG